MDRFKGQIFKIPNLITLFRILIIIPYIIFFLHDNYIGAVLMLLLSGLSDLLDGIVARKFNQITELGKVLDPVADKLTLLAVVISLGFKFPEIIPLAIIFFLKDFTMIIGGLFLIKKNLEPISAKWYGKIATAVFYTCSVVIVCLKAVFNISSPQINIVLLSITALFMTFALYKYSIVFFKMLNGESLN